MIFLLVGEKFTRIRALVFTSLPQLQSSDNLLCLKSVIGTHFPTFNLCGHVEVHKHLQIQQ